MLYIITSDHKPFRAARIAEIVSSYTESELITVDDAILSLSDLEQFLYPSLFLQEPPIIHGKFLLERESVDESLAKQFAASPSIFIFEEFSIPTTVLAVLKKGGAMVYREEQSKQKKEHLDIFSVTACITAKEKKTRWLVYRVAVQTQPIEAILGILYWKVRSLAAKAERGNSYEKLYRHLLEAHAQAWRSGIPLEALIEKVILTQP